MLAGEMPNGTPEHSGVPFQLLDLLFAHRSFERPERRRSP
jgi:hypothetical protein